MDKRFNPLTAAEALQVRRSLTDELAANPAMPVASMIKKIRASLRLTIADDC